MVHILSKVKKKKNADAEMRAEARNVVILRCHKDEECKFSCSQCQCVCKNTWCNCPDDPPATLAEAINIGQ